MMFSFYLYRQYFWKDELEEVKKANYMKSIREGEVIVEIFAFN